FPAVRPSAVALGTIFSHGASLAILKPVFGDTYHQAIASDSKEEFAKSNEAVSAASAWGTSLVGSALQSYGVSALINATGTLSYKAAASLGALIFVASSAPSFMTQIFTEKRPIDTIAVGVVTRFFETIGLSLFLTWWGTRTNRKISIFYMFNRTNAYKLLSKSFSGDIMLQKDSFKMNRLLMGF
ncbi:BgTH12-07662, partial [Blumeria graminis f. sp. triticale]